MTYTALYRKYRPKDFSDVIGQEHIITTLTNQIKGGKASHAYLFTGSRGTGKTTCAKIFAKAVNCLSPKNGSPCAKCKACIALDDPSNIDILEIDAASNNKVDEIRELRERVKYPPIHGKYKVYIIDEVHMLTDSAFNALLKTLEEPPEYVIFVLATTEAHKLPATILSRCMRFDFRLIAVDLLAKLLKKILVQEKKEFENEAVDYISLLGEGSVRDMLSIADICFNYSKGKLTYKDVLSVLGASGHEQISELFSHIAAAKTGEAIKKIDEFATSGKSMSLIAKDIIKYARDLLVLKTVGEALIVDTKENIAAMQKKATEYSAEFLISTIIDFSALDAELRYSISPRIVLETAVIRSSRMTANNVFALSERIRRLEEDGVKIIANPSLEKSPEKSQKKTSQTQVKNTSVAEKKTSFSELDAKTVLGRLLTYFRKNKNMGLYSVLSENKEYKLEDDCLCFYCDSETFLQFSEFEEALKEGLNQEFEGLGLRIVKKSGGVDMDKEIQRLKKIMGSDTTINIKK